MLNWTNWHAARASGALCSWPTGESSTRTCGAGFGLSQNQANRASVTTITSRTLLAALKTTETRSVWREFVGRYCPVIVGDGRSRGLSEEDTEDTAQQTLMLFSKAYTEGQYDRKKSRLRKWPLTIAHDQICNCLRRPAHREISIANRTNQTAFLDRALVDGSPHIWDQEWQKGVLGACIAEARPMFNGKSLAASEATLVKGAPAKEVAERLGMTPNAVYSARQHLLKRIRELFRRVEDVW